MAGQHQAMSYETPLTGKGKARIKELPILYLKALVTPTKTFAREAERANWTIVWFQILLLIAVPALLGLIRGLGHSLSSNVALHSGFLYGVIFTFSLGTSIFSTIFRAIATTLFFFVTISIQFLLAKIFRGHGRYVGQSHMTLLYQVPLAVLTALFGTLAAWIQSIDLRIFTPLMTFLLFAYGIVLNVFVLSEVHQLARKRAILIVVLYYVVLVAIVIGILIALSSLIISAIRHIL